MPIYHPQQNLPELKARLADNDDLLVVCYCAAWCDACTQYYSSFKALAQRLPQYIFIWVDIEDQPELLGDEEVENFPTLLLQTAHESIFFGTQLPYIDHLEKLLSRASNLTPAPAAPPLLRPLLQIL